jgi:hypothetical protein
MVGVVARRERLYSDIQGFPRTHASRSLLLLILRPVVMCFPCARLPRLALQRCCDCHPFHPEWPDSQPALRRGVLRCWEDRRLREGGRFLLTDIRKERPCLGRWAQASDALSNHRWDMFALLTAICQGQDWKLGHLSFCVPALWHLRTSLLGLLYLLHLLCCLDRGSRQGPRPYTNLCMRPRERLRSASCLQDAQLILRWEPRTTGHRCLRDA